MKKLIFSLILSVLFINITTAQRGADRTGFDGDHFSLEGALEIFKQSNSIKDFERNINTRDRYVNNLDLNLDGRIDYIRVEHKRQGDYHAIILQVPISRRDIQDIAVIELEKTGRRTAILQIIGDDYIYGNQIIAEPIATANDNYRNGTVNVYRWPAVRHILSNGYNPWISPYRYSYYPRWWSPWNQYAYFDYYPRTSFYRSRYQCVTNFRLWRVHNFYRPYRVNSSIFLRRSNRVHVANGTQRRIATNRSGQQRSRIQENRRTTGPTRNTASTRTNTRRKASRERTNASIRSNKRSTTSPTRSTTSPTRSATRSTTRRATRRATRSSSINRPKTTTSRSRSTSTIQRSKARTSTAKNRRATTSRRTRATINKRK